MEKIRFFKGNFNELPKERLDNVFYYVIDKKQIIINDMVISEGGGEGGDPAKYNELIEMINKNASDIEEVRNKVTTLENITILNGGNASTIYK